MKQWEAMGMGKDGLKWYKSVFRKVFLDVNGSCTQ